MSSSLSADSPRVPGDDSTPVPGTVSLRGDSGQSGPVADPRGSGSGSDPGGPFANRPVMREAGTVVHTSAGSGTSSHHPRIASGVDSVLHRQLFPQLYSEDPVAEIDRRAAAGQTLGHFRIEEQIGVGGMSAVFRATDTRLTREVALKVLFPHLARDEKAASRFRNEARSGARFDHPNIATVFHYGEDRGLAFIATELIEGRNLRDVIAANGRLSSRDAVNVGLQIAAAIAHMTARDVVHRDIKPSNIQVDPAGRCKLIDLGLARDSALDGSADLTTAGTTLGTFDYISPEQAKDPRQVSLQSDIYSLGCTLYHLLTGRPPYPEGTVLQKLLDHQANVPDDPRKLNANVSPRLAQVVLRMMSNDPSRRHGSIEELVHDLTLVAAELGMRRLPSGFDVWSRPKAERFRLVRENFGWLLTGCLLVLLVFMLDRFAGPVESRVFPPRSAPPPVAQSPDGSDSDPSPEPGSDATPLTPLIADPDDVPPLLAAPGNLPPLLSPEALALLRGAEPSVNPEAVFPLVDDSDPEVTTPLETGAIHLRTPAGQLRQFESLEAACADAPTGSVIELHWTGSRLDIDGEPLSAQPLLVAERQITIRAGFGHRPVLRFQPETVGGADLQTRLIDVDGGRLRVEGITLEVVLAVDQPGTDWAIFSARGCEAIELQGVECRVDNPDQRRVTLFEVRPRRSRPDDPTGLDSLTAPPPLLRLADSFVTGQIDLITVEDARSLRVELQNSAVALDGTLLHVTGEMGRLTLPGQLDLKMSALTCLLGQGLIRLDCGDSPVRELPRLAVTSERNVFASLNPAAPLILMRGALSESRFLERLESWEGVANYYERFSDFIILASSLAGEPRSVELAEWQMTYEPSARSNRLLWLRDDDWTRTPVGSMTRSLLAVELPEPDGGEPESDEPQGVGADLNTLGPSATVPVSE